MRDQGPLQPPPQTFLGEIVFLPSPQIRSPQKTSAGEARPSSPLPFQTLFILPPLDTPPTDRVFISDKVCSYVRVFRVVAWLHERRVAVVSKSRFSVHFANFRLRWAELRKVHSLTQKHIGQPFPSVDFFCHRTIFRVILMPTSQIHITKKKDQYSMR